MKKPLEIQVPHGTTEVVLFRERKPSKAERRKDRHARVMAEVVNIRFRTSQAPEINVNRDLCE